MIHLLIRQLNFDKGNSVITVFALSAAMAVIVILQSFEQGQYAQLENMVKNRGSDLIGVQHRVQNFIATRSAIPQLTRQHVEAIAGVKSVHPLTTLPIIYKKESIQTPVYLIVFDSSGGPRTLTEGSIHNEGRFIVIDRSLAKKHQLNIGDPFSISDFEFEISGITSEAAFMMPFAFINYDGMLDMFLESEIAPDLSTFPLVSYLLIDVDEDFEIEDVRQKIEQDIIDIDVHTASTIANNDVSLGKSFFKPVMGLLVSIGFIMGLVVISLLMYSTVYRNRRNFSILKALGFSLKSLMQYILSLTFILLLLSIPISLVLAWGVTSVIEFFVPVYYFKLLHPVIIGQMVMMVFLFSLIGAFIPYFSIRQCDPVTALKRESD